MGRSFKEILSTFSQPDGSFVERRGAPSHLPPLQVVAARFARSCWFFRAAATHESFFRVELKMCSRGPPPRSTPEWGGEPGSLHGLRGVY